MSRICFETRLYGINSWRILRLPMDSSKELASRGMVIINGTMNNINFQTALEPDGLGSHWFRVNDELAILAKADIGDTVLLEIEPMKTWVEPEIPLDFETALRNADLIERFCKITTKARWEWIRWIRFTNSPSTRNKRIDVACSMLETGKNRPCCFDQSRCTVMDISKNGILSAVE